ncbi:MAG: glycosyltransferase family 9 protein [Candidatus Solibacter sp.]
MTSTSCEQLAQSLLEQCIAGAPPAQLPSELTHDTCARALFGIFVEGLGDRFDPELCDAYADLFAQAIPQQNATALSARYRKVREIRRASGVGRPILAADSLSAGPSERSSDSVTRVLILSRVTLGADVAVTSVILDAAKRAFPAAEITFAGPRKNFELFAADPRLTHAPIDYRRGTLADRLKAWEDLKPLATPATLILDPDSRLTQLGLLPIGDDHLYHLFESRSYRAHTDDNLPSLAAHWAEATLGVPGARPYIAPLPAPTPQGPYIAISLGVGENAAKRIPGNFETQLLALLSAKAPLVIDRGAGGEEAERVERAVVQSGARATYWEGSFAGFANLIGHSSLYVGYDSAGQHVAAAAGIPLVTVFTGFPAERMFHRWRPAGPRVTVVRADHANAVEILAQVAHAIA